MSQDGNNNAGELGYVVPPTSRDITNATTYATNKVLKEVCETDPANWTWIADNIAGYPCPEGLTCDSGTCVFNKTGCLKYSVADVYDCKRHAVDCRIGGVDRTCDVCDYDIDGTQYHIYTPEIPQNEPHNAFCYPGDLKMPSMKVPTDADYDQFVPPLCSGYSYSPMPTPYAVLKDGQYSSVPCTKDAECAAGPFTGDNTPAWPGICINKANYPNLGKDSEKYYNTCTVGPINPEPYLFNGEWMPCDQTSDYGDFECAVLGAGGKCISDAAFPLAREETKGHCYDTGAGGGTFGYLEWRDNVVIWEGEPPVAQCVRAIPQLKTWCEMPWTRGGGSDDSPQMDLSAKIAKDMTTRLHPPFWYDNTTGKCFVTRHYCSGSLGEGGYVTGFGDQHDYLAGILSSCSGHQKCGPSDRNCEIKEGFDCCTTLTQSMAHVVMGRTMTAWLEDYAHGKSGSHEIKLEAMTLLPLLSEDSLKINRHVLVRDFIVPGVHFYAFEWHPDAFRMYPNRHFTSGRRMGLMASELARVFPEHVLRDELNNRHVLLSISELKELVETLARKTENGGVSDDGFMPDNDAMSYSFLKAAFVLLVTDDDLNEVVE
jgi:hypothetical protein